jgi:hypothetical protein
VVSVQKQDGVWRMQTWSRKEGVSLLLLLLFWRKKAEHDEHGRCSSSRLEHGEEQSREYDEGCNVQGGS